MDPVAKSPAPDTASLTPEDYYFENGLMVFTAAYHLRRGTCCSSGCRHCPYGNAPSPDGPTSAC